MRYLIPAAGMGRRMGDTLRGLPKCMIDIGGEPLIDARQLVVVQMAGAGVGARAAIYIVLRALTAAASVPSSR